MKKINLFTIAIMLTSILGLFILLITNLPLKEKNNTFPRECWQGDLGDSMLMISDEELDNLDSLFYASAGIKRGVVLFPDSCINLPMYWTAYIEFKDGSNLRFRDETKEKAVIGLAKHLKKYHYEE